VFVPVPPSTATGTPVAPLTTSNRSA